MDQHNGRVGQLGEIVSFRAPKQVDLALLRAELCAAGFDETLAADMKPQNAMRRALNEMSKGKIVEKLRREDERLYFQVTRKFLGDYEVTYDKECQVYVNVETGFVNGDVSEVVTRAQELLDEHMGKRLKSDMTRMIQKIFDARSADLIPIREEGGAYFVPDMHKELVNRLRGLLGGIGGRLRSYSVRLGHSDTDESVADAMADYLLGKISELEADCEEVDGESRSDVIARRLDRFSQNQKTLEMYRQLMMGLAGAVEERLAEARQKFLAKLAPATEPAMV